MLIVQYNDTYSQQSVMLTLESSVGEVIRNLYDTYSEIDMNLVPLSLTWINLNPNLDK